MFAVKKDPKASAAISGTVIIRFLTHFGDKTDIERVCNSQLTFNRRGMVLCTVFVWSFVYWLDWLIAVGSSLCDVKVAVGFFI
jgi:hypothetical protein